jgi:hypothetical protein
VRKLADNRRVLAAAPGYFAAHGKPATPEALHQHRMLVYNFARNPYELHLTRGTESLSIGITSMLEPTMVR